MDPDDVIALIEEKADEYACPRRILLACAMAESGLDPNSSRFGVWPDVSFGLFHQTVKFADEGDQSASPQNIALIQRLYADPVYACDNAAPRMAAFVRQHGDNEVALFAWNRPNNPHSAPPENKANYRRGLMWADDYLEENPPGPKGPVDHQFNHGFADLAAQLGKDIVGFPVEDETYIDLEYSVQATTTGLMFYSKKANKPYFLPARTLGVGAPPVDAYRPHIDSDPGHVAGTFTGRPKGICLHGSRSGVAGRPLAQEYDGTRSWAKSNPGGLGWNVTIGEDCYSIHFDARQWGWHARAASHNHLSVEIAQPLESYTVTEPQIRALCHWIKTHVLSVWPDWKILAVDLPSHAELEAYGLTGQRDGKTDVYSNGSPHMDALRRRILERLEQ